MSLFSTRNRPAHLGPFPSERLTRGGLPELSQVAPFEPLTFAHESQPELLSNAMAMFIAMLDTIREGPPNKQRAEVPDDPAERSRNLKGAGYFFDAGEVGICELPASARL